MLSQYCETIYGTIALISEAGEVLGAGSGT